MSLPHFNSWYPLCSICNKPAQNRHDINMQLCDKHYNIELRKLKIKQLNGSTTFSARTIL
jgi:hypothetical protein